MLEWEFYHNTIAEFERRFSFDTPSLKMQTLYDDLVAEGFTNEQLKNSCIGIKKTWEYPTIFPPLAIWLKHRGSSESSYHAGLKREADEFDTKVTQWQLEAGGQPKKIEMRPKKDRKRLTYYLD